MRKFSVIALLTFIFSSLNYAQTIKEYRSKILMAEDLILQHNYKEALETYVQAFSSQEFFSKDVYNALALADLMNDSDRFSDVLQYYSKKCITKETLLRDPLVRKHMANEVVRRTVDGFDCTSSRSDIVSFEEYEQLKSLVVEPEKNEKIIRRIVEKKVKKWIKNNILLPSENVTHLLSIKGEQLHDIFISLYCRTRAENRGFTPATDWLLKQVETSRLEPNKAAQWIDLQNDKFKIGTIGMSRGANKINKDLRLYTREFIEEINSNREKLLLDSFETWAEKKESFGKIFKSSSF